MGLGFRFYVRQYFIDLFDMELNPAHAFHNVLVAVFGQSLNPFRMIDQPLLDFLFHDLLYK
jgi:hypothetical protein